MTTESALDVPAFPPEFLVAVAVILLFYQFGLRYVLTYRFTDRAAQVVLVRVIPLISIRYEDVEEVRHVSLWEVLFLPAWRAGNKLFTGPIVLIHRGRKMPVVITPDNAQRFIRELRERVYQKTGQWPLGS
jgi:hypothetical protein